MISRRRRVQPRRLHYLIRIAGVVLAVILGDTPGHAELPVEWKERFWNPHSLEDDFVVPLPCGGAMAFRRVDTPLPENWLTDFRIQLGSASNDDNYASFVRFDHIAGSLSERNDPATRHYFIGKYEVTQDQYSSVMDADCPRESLRGRLPQTRISWFDAVNFAKTLTVWLNKNAPEALPTEDGPRAFLRLPTETEWEFAARGGRAVGEGEFRRQMFPMEEGELSEYVWHQSSQSCNGQYQLVGQLKPNPLGIFDILGNVEEIVLNPFHMNRGGRLHGQTGGMLLKGGSCLTDSRRLSTAARTEFHYFNSRTGEPMTLESAGFRVLIAAPIVVSHQRLQALSRDWPEAATYRAGPAEESLSADPAQSLVDLADATTDIEIRDALKQVSAIVRARDSARADVQRRAVETSIQSAAFIIRQYKVDASEMNALETVMDIMGERPKDPESRANWDAAKRALDTVKMRLQLNKNVYAAVLTQTANDYAPQLLQTQLDIVVDRFERLGAGHLARNAETFTEHVQRWQSTGGLDIDKLTEELK